MTQNIAFALLLFAAVSVATPGPNNLMLMASGANFGFRRTIPHMLGIVLGLPIMVVLVGVGVVQLFDIWPQLHTVMSVAAMVYMLYLAWKIANAAPPARARATGTPMTFLQSAAFQWINPKAWTMSLASIALYASDREFTAILWIAAAFLLVGIFSASSWTAMGQKIGQHLNDPRRLRYFNWVMALLLVGSLVPTLLHG